MRDKDLLAVFLGELLLFPVVGAIRGGEILAQSSLWSADSSRPRGARFSTPRGVDCTATLAADYTLSHPAREDEHTHAEFDVDGESLNLTVPSITGGLFGIEYVRLGGELREPLPVTAKDEGMEDNSDGKEFQRTSGEDVARTPGAQSSGGAETDRRNAASRTT